MIDTSLEYAASMAVSRDLNAVVADGVVYELVILRRKSIKTLLNDVIAVEVLDKGDHAGVEGHNHNGYLLRRG